jgi:hypothetical protein
VVEVERALRYRQGLREVLENFVNFSRFYRGKGAAFQAGSLLLDGRRCNLCMQVSDAGKHAALAGMAAAFLAYCEVTRGGEKKTIVAAFTGGDADNLFVGRNGVFYDRAGKDWDATIIKVVENPISVKQAFWAPYKKLARLIEEQVAKRGTAKDAEANALLDKTATTAANLDATPAPAPKKGVDVGTVAAIGVAVGGNRRHGRRPDHRLLRPGAVDPGRESSASSSRSRAVDAARVPQAAPPQPGADPRRQRLGHQLARAHQRPLRRRAHRPGHPAARSLRSLDDPFAERTPPWRLYAALLVLMDAGRHLVLGRPRQVAARGRAEDEGPAVATRRRARSARR